ncbi:MAG: hypothetical protein C5B53_07895 [Candidatus Melainabacteria bacterium]|nr:MAG: hypothetical protein C5B53_07895 [Candidatus Melainabacteria bacterium]
MGIDPLVTVVIPIRSKDRPQQVLDYLRQSEVDPNQLQVIIVEGNSRSGQRNKAVERATSDFIYFLDDDSYVDKNCIIEALRYFENPDVAIVGGPAVTHDHATFFETCAGLVVSSVFGALITRARNTPCGQPRAVKGDELIGCNLMVRKSAFQAVGGMDARFQIGEDIEFLRRVHESGKLLYYNPKMIVSRTRRKTVDDFVRQFASYGQARGMVELSTHLQLSDFIYFLPSLFLLYLLLLSLCPSAIFAMPLLLYTALALAAAAWIGWTNQSLLLAACTFPLFFVLHLSYGVGVLAGVIKQLTGNSQTTGIQVFSLTELPPAPQLHAVAEVNQ